MLPSSEYESYYINHSISYYLVSHSFFEIAGDDKLPPVAFSPRIWDISFPDREHPSDAGFYMHIWDKYKIHLVPDDTCLSFHYSLLIINQ